MSALGSDNMEKIANNIEKISRSVEQATSGFSRLNVNSYTSQDRADEARAWEERHAEFAAGESASEESGNV